VKILERVKSVKGYLSVYKKIFSVFMDRGQREAVSSVSRGIYGSPCGFEFLASEKSDREMIVGLLMVGLCFLIVTRYNKKTQKSFSCVTIAIVAPQAKAEKLPYP